MAKDLTPDAWIASWASDGTTISFPIASISGLTSGEASTSTGDIRKVVTKLLTTLKTHLDGLADADKPDTLTISQTSTSTVFTSNWRVTGSAVFTPGSDT